MSEIAALILRAVVAVVGVIMDVFAVFSWSERHGAQNSRMGESRLDQEARGWQQLVLRSWHWIALALLAIGALIAGNLWWR